MQRNPVHYGRCRLCPPCGSSEFETAGRYLSYEQGKIIQNKLKYGIQIIKTEYKDKIGVEQSKIEGITNDENEITKILYLMKNNEVTPIGLEDVILEIKNRQAIAKNKKLSYNT